MKTFLKSSYSVAQKREQIAVLTQQGEHALVPQVAPELVLLRQRVDGVWGSDIPVQFAAPHPVQVEQDDARVEPLSPRAGAPGGGVRAGRPVEPEHVGVVRGEVGRHGQDLGGREGGVEVVEFRNVHLEFLQKGNTVEKDC